jgi:hypothetical protein
VTRPANPPLLAWVTLLDAVDRDAFFADLAETAAARDPEAVERCLRQWRLTAEGMTNAELRDRLLES